jgi:hypothetical protein
MDIKNTFRKSFVGPLVFTIFCCIITTIIILLLFTNNSSSLDIQRSMTNAEFKVSSAKVQSTSLLLKFKFQKTFNLINLIHNYFEYYADIDQVTDVYIGKKTENNSNSNNNNNGNQNSSSSNADFKNLLNGYEIFLSKNLQPPFLSRAFWFIDKTQTTVASIAPGNKTYNSHAKTFLSVLSRLLPIVKAFHTSNQYSEATFDLGGFVKKVNPTLSEISDADKLPNTSADNFTNFYLVFNKLKMVAFAPLYSNDVFYNALDSFANNDDCVDNDGKHIGYYNYLCRDWWKMTYASAERKVKYTNSNEDKDKSKDKDKLIDTRDFTISYPYKTADSITKYTVTVCKNIFYDFSNNNSNTNNNGKLNIDDLISICTDIDLGQFFDLFDFYNSKINGYFYAMIVDQKIPLYYPLIKSYPFLTTIEQLEFPIDEKYLVKELYAFKDVLKNITVNLVDQNIYTTTKSNTNNNEKSNSSSGNTDKLLLVARSGGYYKYEVLQNYIVSPILLKEEENRVFHFFNIVYVSDANSIPNTQKSFSEVMTPRVVVQVFLFLIIGLILFLIAWFLITMIAEWIIKPINSMKRSIEGIGSDVTTSYNYSTSFPGSGNSAGLNNHTHNGEPDFGGNNNSQSNNYSKNDEEDENGNEISSSELGKLFNILIEIKNCLSFTSMNKLALEEKTLINYIDSKNTFDKVSNVRGKNLSHSNVGNVFYQLERYDKAVLHFLQVLQINNVESEVLNAIACNVELDEDFEGSNNDFHYENEKNTNTNSKFNSKHNNRDSKDLRYFNGNNNEIQFFIIFLLYFFIILYFIIFLEEGMFEFIVTYLKRSVLKLINLRSMDRTKASVRNSKGGSKKNLFLLLLPLKI